MVHDPMLIQPAVQEVENLGEMICVSAHTNNGLFAKDFSRKVSPPYANARYPPTLDVRDAHPRPTARPWGARPGPAIHWLRLWGLWA